MRKITKLMFALAMFVGGVSSANAEKTYADLSKLQTVESTSASWDGTTNTITWTATSNNMISNFDFAPGDYSSYSSIVVTYSDLNNADYIRVQIRANEKEKTVCLTGGEGTHTKKLTDDFGFAPEDLLKVEWIRVLGSSWQAPSESHNISTETPGSAKITEVYLEKPDVNYIEATHSYLKPDGTTDLKDLTGKNQGWSSTITYPMTLGPNPTLFCGDGDGDYENTHVTIADYDYLVFVVSEASTDAKISPRIWIWNAEIGEYPEISDDLKGKHVAVLYPHPVAECASVTDWTKEAFITSPGVYAVKVTDYKYLKGIKNNWGNAGSIVISTAYAVKGNNILLPGSKYTLVGEELGSVSLTKALADAAATYYDAMLVKGEGIALEAANPNALFVANEGVLANEQNVIVDGTCANLVLTDGHPFATLTDFEATAATYTTIITDAEVATLCLPFEAAIPEGVAAYTLTYAGGDAAKAKAVEKISANAPVLLNGKGKAVFTGEEVEIVANAESTTNAALTGVFAETTVPVGSYVLQNQNESIGFYKVAEGSTITAKPFRAYLTAEAAAARLNIVYGGETTGISTVDTQNADAEAIYTLNGVRVSQPTKGIYVKNGKKFVVK